MNRKLFCEIAPWTYRVSVEKCILARKVRDKLRGMKFAMEKSSELLPVLVYKHNSLIRRKLGNSDLLLQENKARFHANHLHIVSGTAPEACAGLPAPSHVFIGGSSGNLREIMALCRKKNPNCTIVATAIALETVAELGDLMKEYPRSEVCCVSVAQGKAAGPYHLMTAQNPVYIFTFRAQECGA